MGNCESLRLMAIVGLVPPPAPAPPLLPVLLTLNNEAERARRWYGRGDGREGDDGDAASCCDVAGDADAMVGERASNEGDAGREEISSPNSSYASERGGGRWTSASRS